MIGKVPSCSASLFQWRSRGNDRFWDAQQSAPCRKVPTFRLTDFGKQRSCPFLTLPTKCRLRGYGEGKQRRELHGRKRRSLGVKMTSAIARSQRRHDGARRDSRVIARHATISQRHVDERRKQPDPN